MQRSLFLGRVSYSAALLALSAFSGSSTTTVRTTSSFAWTPTRRTTTTGSSTTTTTTTRLFASAADSSTSMSSSQQAEKQCSSSLQVVQIPCLSDNYGYLIHDPATGQTAAIDTPDSGPYQRELKARNWKLTHILNTHHHYDHTGGNIDLKMSEDNVQIVGPVNEKSKIPGIDVAVGGGDTVEFGSVSRDQSAVQIIDVGGHTKGHIAYYFPSESKVFVGDSLFALGCGKMFEGTPVQFWSSLKRLRDLPDDTMVYCAHEYTSSNAKFAASVEPNNAELQARIKTINELRSQNKPTVPSLLGLEKKTNPFLRCDISDEIRTNVGVIPSSDTDADAFAKVRSAKDNFRG